jgi:hypothetical protein
LLLENGANPNTPDDFGNRPLFLVTQPRSMFRDREIADLLRKHGAN